MKNWNAQRTSLTERLADGSRYASGKTVEAADLSNFLQAVIRPGDPVCLEGDNQKQADVLAAALANVDPAKVRDLHMIQSGALTRRGWLLGAIRLWTRGWVAVTLAKQLPLQLC